MPDNHDIATVNRKGLLDKLSGTATDVLLGTGSFGGVPMSGIVPTSRTLTAGAGLTGGGDLSANRSFAVDLTPITNSLGADVALNNTGNYFTGPTVAQGSTGTWFASGTITLSDSAGAATFLVKLWDGTTVIASTVVTSAGAGFRESVALSGPLASPAGNIRISVKDGTSTSGKIEFNGSGESKDATLTAIRIG